MSYEEFWQPLQAVYERGEAKAVARLAMETAYGLTLTDIVSGRVQTLDEEPLLAMRQRLMTGEPVQYVLGKAYFGNRLFSVSNSVLIPRPETFELCQWIITNDELRITNSELGIKHILDIGTGSGCIAVTLAAELPQARVTAWDVSQEALNIAKENATRHHVDVTFEQVDILAILPTTPPWDMIVSNPPYICQSERAGMEANVLEHEPELALFVPDDDPLRFYRSIARYAQCALAPDGRLFFEINPLYTELLEELLRSMCFIHTEIRQDQFGKERFICTYR